MRNLTDNERKTLEGSKAQEKYYIGKKQYIPDECDLLCRFTSLSEQRNAFWGGLSPIEESLYRTAKGTYFTVKKENEKTDVKIVTEEEAFDFMDDHASGIDTEIYNKIFGEPEKG